MPEDKDKDGNPPAPSPSAPATAEAKPATPPAPEKPGVEEGEEEEEEATMDVQKVLKEVVETVKKLAADMSVMQEAWAKLVEAEENEGDLEMPPAQQAEHKEEPKKEEKSKEFEDMKSEMAKHAKVQTELIAKFDELSGQLAKQGIRRSVPSGGNAKGVADPNAEIDKYLEPYI
jgi:uncharacterized membrane protein YkoI